MSFITVFFAYVACAYIAGSKITLIQSIALTVAYSLFSLLTISGVYTNLNAIYEVVAKFDGEYYFEDPEEMMVYVYGGPLSLIAAWFMSIVYMISQYLDGNKDK
jgi:hypothetical protein